MIFFFLSLPILRKTFWLDLLSAGGFFWLVFVLVWLFPMAYIAVICTLGTRWSELSTCPYWADPLGDDVWQSGSSERFWYLQPSPAGWDVVRTCCFAWSESRIFPAVPSAGGKDSAPPLQLEHPAPLGLPPHRLGMGEREYVSLPIHLQFHLLCLWRARYIQTILGQEIKTKGLFFLCSKKRKHSFY